MVPSRTKVQNFLNLSMCCSVMKDCLFITTVSTLRIMIIASSPNLQFDKKKTLEGSEGKVDYFACFGAKKGFGLKELSQGEKRGEKVEDNHVGRGC